MQNDRRLNGEHKRNLNLIRIRIGYPLYMELRKNNDAFGILIRVVDATHCFGRPCGNIIRRVYNISNVCHSTYRLNVERRDIVTAIVLFLLS